MCQLGRKEMTKEILEGIRNADYGEHGLTCLRVLRLGPQFFTALATELDQLARRHSPSVVSDEKHATNWTNPYGTAYQFSLLNASGRFEDTSVDHTHACFGKRFHHGAEYPTLARFIEFFPHCLNFRLNILAPASGLAPHEEQITLRTKSGVVGLRARFHLPVFTNSRAEILLNGAIHHFREGVVYFLNNGCVHAARNGGPELRAHLVWDMFLTREAFDTMFGERALAGLPMHRFLGPERAMTPIRHEEVAKYASQSPLVSRSEAERVSLITAQ